MFVDSHCHLDFPGLAENEGEILDRARSAGVTPFLSISTKLSRFTDLLALAERHDDVYCSVGVHPHEVKAEGPVDAAQLIRLTEHRKVIGIGETGLDYYYEHSPRASQQHAFLQHIQAARETALPLIVHAREADDDLCRILTEEYAKGPFPGLIHCFSSTKQLSDVALEIGFYISVSGILTFRSAEALRAVVETIPLNRLLIETDAPYLAPVPERGKPNEPAFVTHTAAKLAELRNCSIEEIARITSENFFDLFVKAAP